MPIYFTFLLAVISVSFLPGYLIYSCFFRKDTDSSECIAAFSFALSVPFISTIHFLSFIFSNNLILSNISLYILSVCLLYFYSRKKKVNLGYVTSNEIWAFVLYNAYCLILLMTLPSYNLAYMADWRIYYPNVSLYLKQSAIASFTSGVEMEYLVRRTPFFSLFNSFFLSFCGNSYYFFQITSTFVNSLIFWCILLIAKYYYGRKAMVLTMLLLPLMPIITCRLCIPTPKPLSTCFILLTYFLYFQIRGGKEPKQQRQNKALLAICVSAAYMIHPIALFYFIWLAVDQLYLRLIRKIEINWELMWYTLGALLIIAAPWYLWAITNFGFQKVLTPSYTISEIRLPLDIYIYSRISMLFTTLFMSSTFSALFRKDGLGWGYHDNLVWLNPLVKTYLDTFLAGFTFSGMLFFGMALKKLGKIRLGGIKPLMLWALLGGLTCLAFHFLIDLKGLAFNIMGPLVVLVFIFLCSIAVNLPRNTRITMFILVFLEFVFIRMVMFRLTFQDKKTFVYLYEKVWRTYPYTGFFMVLAIISISLGYCYVITRNPPRIKTKMTAV